MGLYGRWGSDPHLGGGWGGGGKRRAITAYRELLVDTEKYIIERTRERSSKI